MRRKAPQFMIDIALILLLASAFSSIISVSAQTQNRLLLSDCLKSENFTSNSNYNKNVLSLLFKLSTLSSSSEYSNATVGDDGPDKINGLFLCRPDFTQSACQTCVSEATQAYVYNCTNKKSIILWFDQCMIRYTNESLDFSLEENYLHYCPKSYLNVSQPNAFPNLLNSTMEGLIANATSENNSPWFAKGSAVYTKFETLSGLVICMPHMTDRECEYCLRKALHVLPSCAGGLSSWTNVLSPSCQLRYNTAPTFSSSSSPLTPPREALAPALPPSNSTNTFKDSPKIPNKKKASVVITVALPVITAAILVLLLSGCYWFYKRKKEQRVAQNRCTDLTEISGAESLHFHFNTIKVATNDFSVDNKLGQGGFGPVYKGMLHNGQEIAVKRLGKNSGQGIKEFKNEVILLVKLQHKNLVRLLGYCVERKERILVYELVPNLSLEKYLFDPDKRALLDWPTRYKIITGIARGLMYLHEDSRLKIIHRDLKCSNVLLDNAMNPKISDFGTARLFGEDQVKENTNRIVGTYGYMAPEYAMDGQFSTKSDVYSFGVIILEIVSGQSNTYIGSYENQLRLVLHAWTLWNETNALALVDSALGNILFDEEVTKCIHIGLLCVQDDATKRPTMPNIVHALNDNYSSINLPKPTPPQFLIQNDIVTTQTGSSSHKSGSLATAEMTDLYPR